MQTGRGLSPLLDMHLVERLATALSNERKLDQLRFDALLAGKS